MARLHEYQGKQLLSQARIAVPEGGPADSPEQARTLAARLDGPVVVKMQAWTTSRAAQGGILFADTPDQAAQHASRMLGMKLGSFEVDTVLVERKLDIAQEFYASVTVDDAAAMPLLLFTAGGGSGIEERAQAGGIIKHHIDVRQGLPDYTARNLVRGLDIHGTAQRDLATALVRLVNLAITVEARSAEINPLVITANGKVLAADCRITVDDYAVFRHPELGIEIARELDHPPTRLERIAYAVERDDHRDTFYFAQLATDFNADDGYVGFHGAGGGGSMMSMDAVSAAGFKLANFTDTSGNPSAAKVYRAARIILSQPNIVGYFGSGSGVASQEQYHSAYGLAKAFWEMNLNVPAVIRLGGNSEDRAVQILTDYCKDLPAKVEGYKKDDAPNFCAQRLRTLVDESRGLKPAAREAYVPPPGAVTFDITGGKVYLDVDRCDTATNAVLLEHSQGIFKIENNKPTLALSPQELANKDSELIACEVECRGQAQDVLYVDLAIPGLDDDGNGADQ
ncbi:MAG: ATP-grasp domain-containing protein [Phycisphaerae bacterium]